MKFELQFWKRWEYPSYEKLNTLIDGINNHIKHRKTLDGIFEYTDPNGIYEHWASVVRCLAYPDVQWALDNEPSGTFDTYNSAIIVAPESRRAYVSADYYVNDPSAELPAILDAAAGATVFFLAGDYLFTTDFTINDPVTLVGESSATTRFIFSDGARLLYSGNANPDASPVKFKDLLFQGSYEEFVSGIGMTFSKCIFYYQSATHEITGIVGLIETSAGDYPKELRINNCRFIIHGPGVAFGSNDAIVYENLIAIKHDYGKLYVTDSVIDYYFGPSVYFQYGIYATKYLKISNSRIVTYDETIFFDGAAEDLIIENCELGRKRLEYNSGVVIISTAQHTCITRTRMQHATGPARDRKFAIYQLGAFDGFIGMNLFNTNIDVNGNVISNYDGFNSIVEKDLVFNFLQYP